MAIDKDLQALTYSKNKLEFYKDKIIFVNSDFKNIVQILKDHNIEKVDGILVDLGVSSYQIDTPERGFSYAYDGKLDMRMDLNASLSAYDVVNNYDEESLANVIYNYGEEVKARQIAKQIVKQRQIKPIETTFELKELIDKVYNNKFLKGVSKKTFQAIRIEVNGELDYLEQVLQNMIDRLAVGGRLAVISFHSLEDRIIKNIFKLNSQDCICDINIPVCKCNHKASIKLITKKPIISNEKELSQNSRASSAKLRIIEKL